jgi:hypothetical protein
MIINYLLNYPLFSSKYLDFLDWKKVVNIFSEGEHKTSEGKLKILNIKSGINNKRKNFSWDHLQKFYNLKI